MNRRNWLTMAFILLFGLVGTSISIFAQGSPDDGLLARQVTERATPTATASETEVRFGSSSAASQEHRSNGLFIDAGMRSKDYSDEESVIRGRFVRIDFDLLDGSKRIVLNPFDDATFTAVLERVESNPSGSYTWIGHLEGIEHSQATFVVRDDLVVGQFSIPTVTGNYEVRYAGDELHEVVQVNPLAFMPSGDDAIPVELPEEDTRVPTVPSVTDDGSVIDLMVVYTANAREEAGGTAAIESEIELAVANTNQAYNNSDVNQRLFLVHQEEVSYEETGSLASNLNRLRDPDDGFMDNVHALRDTYHADQVSLVVEGNDSIFAGIAYLMTDVSISFESWAFATAKESALWYVVLEHELGHNMGLNHDWYEDGGTTPFTHAHGYVNNDSSAPWRTIMAYNDLCEAQEFSCPTLRYFSNPNISYNGAPMGVPSGSSANCIQGQLSPDPSSCDADSHSVLNTTASTFAQFRSSAMVWTGATSSDWHTASNWTMEEGAPDSTTTVQRVPRFIDSVIIPSDMPNSPTISAEANVRDMIIESGATLNMTGGTLNLYGNWEKQGTGAFNASSGTVVFKSTLNQTIQTNSGSNFNHLQIGDGIGTQKVTLLDGSELKINGNLTLKVGAIFEGGSSTINLAGHWNDEGNGFVAGMSSVILDGASQTLQKEDKSVLLSEDFSAWDGSDRFSWAPPTGWATTNDGDGTYSRWRFGDSIDLPNYPYRAGHARRWYGLDETIVDAWLFSPALLLDPDVTYQLDFNYGISEGSDPQEFSVYYGNRQTSDDMATQIFNQPEANNISWNQAQASFTVPSYGSYYLGFRNFDASPTTYGSAGMDDIILTAIQDMTFYNLTVNSTGSGAIFKNNVVVKNDLLINQIGLMNLQTNDLTVEGTVSNLGTLQQSKEIRDGTGATTYEFLSIKNAAGDETKYYGVNITPDDDAALGWTFVRISGDQECTSNSADSLINRCFNITPNSPNSATIKFWFTEAERNAQEALAIKVWRHNGSSWTQVGESAAYGSTGSTCSTDAECWYEWRGISSFSPMVAGSGSTPTGQPLSSSSFPTPTAMPTSTPTHTPDPNSTPTATPTSTPDPNTTPTPTETAASWECWDGSSHSSVKRSLDPCHHSLSDVELVSPTDGWAVGNGVILRWDGSRWNISEQFSDIWLSGLDMVSATDGWAVGRRGTILHWDGSAWSRVASPTAYSLTSVAMLNSTSGWAVGSGGTILQWDGSAWSVVDSPTSNQLNSVKMVSATAGWAVGANGTILRWNGSTWIEEFSSSNHYLSAIDVVSSTEAWIVGGNGIILRRQNGYWIEIESQSTSWLYSVEMLNSTDGWAIGSFGTILHWDGNSWSEVTRPAYNNLQGLSFVSSTEGWAVGVGGTILQWDGSAWSVLEEPTYSWLYSVDMLSPTDAWAVGSAGTILRWNGSNWNQVSSPIFRTLYSVDMISRSDGWAVGYNGTILHWDGSLWNVYQSPTTQRLSAVTMRNSSSGWAVGDNGTILRWDGNNWTVMQSPTTENLNSIASPSNTDGWAVGDNGTILRWDGSAWHEFDSPTSDDLSSISMSSSAGGWAVGTRIMLHWDGNNWNAIPSNSWLYGVTMSPTSGWIVDFMGSTRHWNGRFWSFVSSPTSNTLFSVATNGTQSWAVGAYGTILHIGDKTGPEPNSTPTPTSTPNANSTPTSTPNANSTPTSTPNANSTPTSTPTSGGEEAHFLYLPAVTR